MAPHLTGGVDGLQRLAGQGVPELDAPVGGAASTSQQAVLVRGPGYRLDGRNVVRVGLHGR